MGWEQRFVEVEQWRVQGGSCRKCWHDCVCASELRRGESSADVAVAAVQEVAAQPKTGPIENAKTFVVDRNGDRTVSATDASVSIELGDSPAIELTSDFYESLFIDGGLPGGSETASNGALVFESASEDYSVVPLPYEDGSVQLVNVLSDKNAPDRYDYTFSSTTPVSILLREGIAVIVDDSGDYLGGVAAPWAYDANGTAVPTHFEANGATLTQVVDHHDGGYVYPITADPYANRNLWGGISEGTAEGQPKVSLTLTAWGNQNFAPWILIDYGWPEATNRNPRIRDLLVTKASMRQQYDCHAFGAAVAGTWDLERFRPNRTIEWSVGVAVHLCNWKTADRY